MRLLVASAIAIVAGATAASAAPRTFPSSAGNLTVETIASGLVNPWALAFLPDGRLLVTEKAGRMRIVGKDGKLSAALGGVPQVFARGQGGLHDVVLDRDYAQNNTIYFCFAEPANGGGRTVAGAREARRRRHAAARRREGDLPPGGPAVERQPLRLPHRAGRRRQSVPDHGRSLRPPQRGAEPRQPYRQDRARPPGRLGAARQSVRRPRGRQAGNLELRPPQRAGRRDPSADRQAVGARARPARRRRDQHRARPARTTAGR